MPILGDFAVKYGAHAEELGVPMDDLYQALVDTAENTVRFFDHLKPCSLLTGSRYHSLRIGTQVRPFEADSSFGAWFISFVKLEDKIQHGKCSGTSQQTG